MNVSFIIICLLYPYKFYRFYNNIYKSVLLYTARSLMGQCKKKKGCRKLFKIIKQIINLLKSHSFFIVCYESKLQILVTLVTAEYYTFAIKIYIKKY